jgi:hypothetical protein
MLSPRFILDGTRGVKLARPNVDTHTPKRVRYHRNDQRRLNRQLSTVERFRGGWLDYFRLRRAFRVVFNLPRSGMRATNPNLVPL